MKWNLNYKKQLHHALFILTITVMMICAGYSIAEISQNDNDPQEQLLINNSKALLDSINQLSSTLKLCDVNIEHCSNEILQSFVNNLQDKINDFQQSSSNEKTLLLSTGISTFDLISINISEYYNTNDIPTFHNKVSLNLEDADLLINTFLSNNFKSAENKRNSIVKLILALNITLTLILIFYHLVISRTIIRLRSEKNTATETFKTISNNLRTIQYDKVKERISTITTTDVEKNIYAKLLSNYEQLEEQKSKTDLYQHLYNLLGYEVRGITNTIQGGINLLVKDSDEKGALLAKEILSATSTLENLADNFNRLSSIESMKGSQTINFYELISELVVLISTKSKQQNKSIECFIENAIPSSMYGNQTGLFWLLLLQISNMMSSSVHNKLLLHVGVSGAKRVERLTINCDLYFYIDTYKNIDEITNLEWDDAYQKDITNIDLASNLLSGIHNYSAIYHDLKNTKKLALSFDINATKYIASNDRLAGKTILVCGSSGIQVDLISRTLTNEGATVKVASTANDIFKMMAALNENDGIFLTENIQGITFNSFCKTLKSRLSVKNIKLMLAISDVSEMDDIYNHVDYVFYYPFTPTDFIDNVSKILSSERSAEEELNNRFLIVEDDKIQQFILSTILTGFDFNSTGVDDGSKALALIKENDFDIIFMDCIMPGMGGIEATSLIRKYEKDHARPPVTIIGATGLTSNKEHKLCIDAGMDYVIGKPYKKDEIYSVIKKYMAIRKVG